LRIGKRRGLAALVQNPAPVLPSAKGAPALQRALKLMVKRSASSLDLAAIALLPPDLASSLVHGAYFGERMGRSQRPHIFD